MNLGVDKMAGHPTAAGASSVRSNSARWVRWIGRVSVVAALLIGALGAPVATETASAKEPATFGAITHNCGIVTCSLYLSRSGTRSAKDFLENRAASIGRFAAQHLTCVAIGATAATVSGPGGLAVGFACEGQFFWIDEALEDAAERGVCLKMTYTKPRRGIPPVITYWSTNNGDHCHA